MANYSSVLAFDDDAYSTLSRLDAVVVNAGVSLHEFELAEGIESTLTINVVSTFLLAQLVKACPPLQMSIVIAKCCKYCNRSSLWMYNCRLRGATS